MQQLVRIPRWTICFTRVVNGFSVMGPKLSAWCVIGFKIALRSVVRHGRVVHDFPFGKQIVMISFSGPSSCSSSWCYAMWVLRPASELKVLRILDAFSGLMTVIDGDWQFLTDLVPSSAARNCRGMPEIPQDTPPRHPPGFSGSWGELPT